MQHEAGDGKKGGWKTWFWMAACCLPIIAVIALGYCGVSSP